MAADYAAVRELVADLFAQGIEATVPATVRETVECSGGPERTGSVARRARREARARQERHESPGAGRNRPGLPREPGETRRGRPARIVLGSPMPEMMKLLPETDDLGA